MTNAEIKIPVTKTTRTNPPTPFFKGGDTGITKGGEYRVSSDSVDFNLIGQNPTQNDALSVLCKDGSPFTSAGLGFTTNFLAATAYKESRFAEFTNIQGCNPTPTTPPTNGYPVQACDNGYGIMQLTQGIPGGLNYDLGNYTNTPTQNMVWNWVANINAGENVMMNKFTDESTSESIIIMNVIKNCGSIAYYTPPTTDQIQMNVWQ